jgi:hypothetical protein
MSRVLTYLGRFAVIIAGFALAALASSAFLNLVSFGSLDPELAEAPLVARWAAILSTPFVALFVAYFAFVPALLVILLGEFLPRRDWLFYAIAGAVVSVLVIGYVRGVGDAAFSASRDPFFVMAMLGGGMVGGIAYWVVAGRRAGVWRDRLAPPPISPAP